MRECYIPEVSYEFAAAMESAPCVYVRPLDPAWLYMCLDERFRQFMAHGAMRCCLAAQETPRPGTNTVDSLYETFPPEEAAHFKVRRTPKSGGRPNMAEVEQRCRLGQRPYDEHLYKQRDLAENALERIKRWRGQATHYYKRVSSFVAAVKIRCLALRLHIS